ncbi:hypothetical protein T459_28556 [Capsicum annuum]|uniref:MBD domain-containing protein n=1 Tax=Capsicum annuum TaxID=4072 RepID=A0A2G2YH84_CAPAN|nr:hypothetical protein T459_28556 [Capsicum annuum]
MTGLAAAGLIPPVAVTGVDDGIPPDSLLQLETYIGAERNSRFETARPNKADIAVEEGKEVDLATPVSVESESKMEVPMKESVVETVTPVYKVNRSVEVNVKRPSWLPEDWKFEPKVRTNGASAGAVENYYYEPVSGKRFRSKPDVLHFLETGGRCKRSTGGDATPSETPNSKKQKKSSSMKEEKKTTSSYSDSLNPPQSVCWVLMDSAAETLTPFIHGKMIPEGQKQEWDAVFSTVSQRNANRDAGVSNHRDLIVVDGFLLWRRNRQKVFHLNYLHDVQVWSVIGVVEPVNLKHFTRMDICEKLSQVRAMEVVTNACVGVGCLYCTILGVASEV